MNTVRPLVLLSEVLLIGVLVTVTSLPLLTAPAAGAAGAVLLTDLVRADRTPSVARYLRLFGAAVRNPLAALAPLGLLVVGGLDVLAVLARVPGGRPFGWLLGAVLATVIVAGLRTVVSWAPDRSWREAAARGGELTVRDPLGSAMLAVAVVVLAVVVTQAPAFVVIAPGLLLLAAVAVPRRLG
ncbi:hypothetical protein FHX82_006702 [Amycolatopsis bartoniae]|uniref:DUF624 domain-containing protein n=1 Tax=Amycolatopsis bartoniae TaxID=941986 RepID=A0A8H9MC08_9PSEU|nr:hypothetical protein [Amycolatopsis bartoniae]MBB2939616.1 hypothetical protein [Amycolatopsis bartoniae]TVT07822.1 hypothetical protein FNH07_14950 [Amycolatopsis bartoniae]GHF39645.1 hypothetical protein GCM10017566_11180 [Amycolatopsis bartoniae]